MQLVQEENVYESLTAPEQQEAPITLTIGPDRLTISQAGIIIDALHPMPEWQIREYCRIPIRFQNERYFLAKKEPGEKPYAVRYHLTPWGDSGLTRSAELFYDEQSVAQREQDLKTGHQETAVRAVLLLFYPFLGLLWSKTKDKLVRVGFVPRTITGVSIMLTFSIMFVDVVFVKMLMMRSLRSGEVVIGGLIRAFYGEEFLNLGAFQLRVLWLDCLLFACLVLDIIIRYSQHLGEAESPWGFMEWITYPFTRKSRNAATDE